MHSGDPVEHISTGRVIADHSGSAQTFSLVNHWITECTEKHFPKCSSAKSKLPTRLVDVGSADGSEEPKLHIPSDSGIASAFSQPLTTPQVSIRYVALSYCWGSLPFLTTTTSNIENMKKGIPINKLPATIRDAIIITRAIGVRYIWIDALCILQGTDIQASKDWETESRKMAEVFGSAYLTICAASARNAGAGILVKRTPLELPEVRLPYPSRKLWSYDDHHVVLGLPRTLVSEKEEPLNQRAWTLQEKMLSKRLIIYGTSQMS